MVNQFHDLGHRGLELESTLGETLHLDLFKIGKRRDKKGRNGSTLPCKIRDSKWTTCDTER